MLIEDEVIVINKAQLPMVDEGEIVIYFLVDFLVDFVCIPFIVVVKEIILMNEREVEVFQKVENQLKTKEVNLISNFLVTLSVGKLSLVDIDGVRMNRENHLGEVNSIEVVKIINVVDGSVMAF